MTARIEPALSAEQWAFYRAGDMTSLPSVIGDVRYCITNDARTAAMVVAIANHLLPDSDPRRVTRAGIAAMRSDVEWLELRAQEEDLGLLAIAKKLRDTADALESYLPPVDTDQ